ncbi:Sialic acid-binding Ig-like lectin 5 [Microtus ochrogaster]|uniref:Sialic acid-binding Ig-like lectin 5 n=1 Tax=Microtus ochrogaster TaxID=79684 RepID=A0A8J6GU83_MICOH|nr:Sialic acid-binding Ig-like lectin 5 [Microtus ochrogaster]
MVTSPVTVQEGLCIYVSCQARFPAYSSPIFGYWFQEKANTNSDPPVATNDPNRPVQKEAQGRFHLMGGRDPHNCSLEIRDVKRSDTQVYFFRVDDGDKVKWSFKDSKNLLSVTVTEPETLHSGSSLHIQEGESLRLVCAADSNPPAVLNWEQQTQKHIQLSNEELQLPRVELEDHGKYICRAQNSLGAQVASLSLIVRSLLQLLAPSCSWEAEGLHCSCSSRAWPAPSLRWWLGEGLLERNSSNNSFQVTSSSSGPWANSSLILSKEFSAGHRLRCEAWNDNEVQSATMLLLPSQEGHLNASGSQNQKDRPPFVTVLHTLADEPELHYASLSFHNLKPRQPQNTETIKSDYTEIKIRKC